MKNISTLLCLLPAVATTIWGYMSKGSYFAIAIMIFWIVLYYLISIKLKLSNVIQAVVYLSFALIIAIFSYSNNISGSGNHNQIENNETTTSTGTKVENGIKDDEFYDDLVEKYTIEKKVFEGNLKNNSGDSSIADRETEADLLLTEHLAAIEYRVTSQISGEYRLNIKIKPDSNDSEESDDLSIVINGQNSFTLPIPKDSNEEWLWIETTEIVLKEGENIIEIIKIANDNKAIEIDGLKLIPVVKEPS